MKNGGWYRIVTINLHVVYMARYVIVLRRARSITRGIGRGGPWKLRFFWALKWLVPFGLINNGSAKMFVLGIC